MRLTAKLSTAGLSLAALAFFAPAPAAAQANAHVVFEDRSRSPMGSLAATGGVEVNGAAVPAQSIVYAGDSITTHDNGTATLTISNRGEFELAPVTQVVFSDDSRYAAQLNLGTLTFDTLPGSNLGVRAGEYVVAVAPDSLADTSATVRRTSDGAGLVSCAKGRVQVVALEGDTSLALGAGQSTSFAAETSKISAVLASDPIVAPAARVRSHRLRTVLIIAGAAAAATAIAVIASEHGGVHPTAAAAPAPTPPAPTPTPNPPTANPPASNPPTSNPPTANPPTSNPPTSNPPTANPPTSNPPTSNPPTSNPPPSGGGGDGGGNGKGKGKN